MGEKVQISFVLAIYNVSKYLKECIDSIISENSNGVYEVILVDDGSTDDSAIICDEYGEKYPQIKAFHKKNGGLSDARNYGLDKATGRYVFFVDADDYLPKGSIKKLLNVAAEKNSDVIVWNCSVINENGDIVEYCNGKYRHPALKRTRYYSSEEFITTQLIGDGDFPRTVWLGMYKRKFLLNQNLWFQKGILHEDELWTPKVYLEANDIYYMNDELYCYRIRANSIMNKMDKDYSRNLQCITYIYNELPIFFDYSIKNADLRQQMKADVAKRYLSAIAKYEAYKYPEIANNIRKFEIFRNANTKRDKVRAAILGFSVKIYCQINNRLGKSRKS